jgi:hypothetical protein
VGKGRKSGNAAAMLDLASFIHGLMRFELMGGDEAVGLA